MKKISVVLVLEILRISSGLAPYHHCHIATQHHQDEPVATSRRCWLNTASAAITFVTIPWQPVHADVGGILKAANENSMITYSKNAKNFQRIAEGDKSAGSQYTNENFKSPAAAKRRALTGCKFDNARREAGIVGSEKDCNQRVLAGETEFMLEALKKLDCPSCAYGIQDSGPAASALKFATSI
uniref:Uncharacterized protein n=1 Tax=Octactis speculum TaxID=3111310 RepID=A0A7S2ATC8_9STRA|mmetsp:Transcript_15309/g.20536  ORF Transcript_15309/g.20536 Transcript_15309/m.20536 type:complete len:184 (+) Transcript_15309:15-566(+)|eukprot:CAMPEP_0185781472 /NCGR_PEP_ID=MMETSP1174-20130828/102586_1 /TAXON_ID=35687 /ORGANISM="Dictyocha speculum, Strain CCMP1381" /LENGTH=183 /DNA_ID=CAMNT_0028471465 /DNA_START=15 /DNA_END=566 /DNA_ORIENTATION=-